VAYAAEGGRKTAKTQRSAEKRREGKKMDGKKMGIANLKF
jgi:hypothetical protein